MLFLSRARVAQRAPRPPPLLFTRAQVVHGCVGNRAAVLPLQLLGVETDVLNTVQYSNHVGYGSFAGEKLSGEQLSDLLRGMHKNGLLAPSHVLTGYMGSVETVRAVVEALPQLRASRPGVQYWCDPVLGDHGRVYVPPLLVEVYRDEIVPHAHALLPNQFEAELLSGVTIRSERDARRACGVLHRRGVNLVVITSAQLEPAVGDQPARLTVILSQRPHGTSWRREYRISIPQLPQRFTGTGDLLAALLLGWISKPELPLHTALRRAVAGVQAVLQSTVAQAGAEAARMPADEHTTLGLRLLQSIDEIRSPDEGSVGEAVRLDAPLAGVVFDMDGTLTLPHTLDFDAMRRAAGLPEGAHIRSAIEALPAERRAAAWGAVEALELEAEIELQPGLVEMLAALRERGIKCAIATRNTARGVDKLLASASLPADTFDPVLTRDCPHPDKPHPSIALAAAAAWGVAPEACLMVGDTMDDMRCGRAAGMATCLMHGDGDGKGEPPLPDEVDFSIRSLSQLHAMLDDAAAPL